MLNLKNYTISSLKSLEKLPQLDVAQVTLNSRMFPSKRKTVEYLKILNDYHNTKLIIHYDYIYIISRYCMFSDYVKKAIIDEISDIMHYAQTVDNIVGIVMHTDYPFNSKLVHTKDSVDKIYKSAIWDSGNILSNFSDKSLVLYNSLSEFARDLNSRVADILPLNCKVYIENTTKVPRDLDFEYGSIESIDNLIQSNCWSDLYGVCTDTEHEYALTGNIVNEEFLSKLQSDVILHLNAIPEGVTSKSHKDRHSETTIFECSLNGVEFYKRMIEYCNNYSVPFVREVKEETMFLEQEQLRKYNLEYGSSY